MEEIGRVVEIRGVMAKVVVTPKGECSRCAAATFCSALTGGDRIIEARNPLGARIGDTVKVAVPSSAALTSAFFIFVMPILFVLIGIGIGSAIGKGIPQIIGGVMGFIIGLIILRMIDKKLRGSEKFSPRIVEIHTKFTEENNV